MTSADKTTTGPRGVLLGIDHGEKIIGLALCDASWIIARPLSLLERTTRAADFAKIKAVIARHDVRAIVLGIPLNTGMDSESRQASTVRRWATRLAAAVEVPVYLWEEGYSSFEAERITLALEGTAGAQRRGRIDDRAAALILQSFIDAHPPGTPLPRPVRARPVEPPHGE